MSQMRGMPEHQTITTMKLTDRRGDLVDTMHGSAENIQTTRGSIEVISPRTPFCINPK